MFFRCAQIANKVNDLEVRMRSGRRPLESSAMRSFGCSPLLTDFARLQLDAPGCALLLARLFAQLISARTLPIAFVFDVCGAEEAELIESGMAAKMAAVSIGAVCASGALGTVAEVRALLPADMDRLDPPEPHKNLEDLLQEALAK
eukprot:SAG11_NODE_5344_length_1589_cov_1.253020_3_plen_146_part_00